jgi:hypothetical protein
MIKKILLIPLALLASSMFSNAASAQLMTTQIEPEDIKAPSCKQYITQPDWRGYIGMFQIPVDPIPVDKIVCVAGDINEPIVQAIFDDNFVGNIAYGTRQGIYTGFFEDGSIRVSHYTKNRDGIIDSLTAITEPEMYLRVGNLKFIFNLDHKTNSYRMSKKAVIALSNAYNKNEKVVIFLSPKGLVNNIGPETVLKFAQLFLEYTPFYEPVGAVIKSKDDPLYIPPTHRNSIRESVLILSDEAIEHQKQINNALEYGF